MQKHLLGVAVLCQSVPCCTRQAHDKVADATRFAKLCDSHEIKMTLAAAVPSSARWEPEHLLQLNIATFQSQAVSAYLRQGDGMQVYQADETGNNTVFCISAIVGGGPAFTVVLGANFHRAYYAVYEYDAYTDTAQVSSIKWVLQYLLQRYVLLELPLPSLPDSF